MAGRQSHQRRDCGLPLKEKRSDNEAPTPGETIKEEFLVPLGMSVNALANELGIGAARLNEIVRGRRGVTADTALRVARYFGTTPELWINLQTFYDLRVAQRRSGRTIERGSHNTVTSGRRSWRTLQRAAVGFSPRPDGELKFAAAR
jgi:addiction module HigA family antidote